MGELNRRQERMTTSSVRSSGGPTTRHSARTQIARRQHAEQTMMRVKMRKRIDTNWPSPDGSKKTVRIAAACITVSLFNLKTMEEFTEREMRKCSMCCPRRMYVHGSNALEQASRCAQSR